jgi:hypothetical protein
MADVDSFEEDFRTAILSAAVAAIVGDRVTWGELPQGATRPLIALWNTTDLPDYKLSGPSGLQHVFVQIDVWSITLAESLSVARAVKASIDGLTATIGGTEFQGVFFRGRRNEKEPIAGAPAQTYHRVSLDVEIWYAATESADS